MCVPVVWEFKQVIFFNICLFVLCYREYDGQKVKILNSSRQTPGLSTLETVVIEKKKKTVIQTVRLRGKKRLMLTDPCLLHKFEANGAVNFPP